MQKVKNLGMLTPINRLADAAGIASKVNRVWQKRAGVARKHFTEATSKALQDHVSKLAKPRSPWDWWMNWYDYATDVTQRSILFWDTMRQRGNIYLEHERAGKPPLLHFKYEMVLDGRKFDRPVNYALLRILPPKGVTVDPKKRPYLIIDPRAGHGPGIGGFKDDSQVGVALEAGHPVYFVIFYTDPEPGQTMLDVTVAEKQFVRRIRELHPQSPKPVLVGNCQGGWAAMMLAASDANDTGPVVINGAPMSYWGGAWAEGEGDNPMRYAGGLVGGTWPASFMADLGNGIFDGAWLAQNFENLNPANTLWDKYYHVFANVDTEPPRFLQFERWWGGYYLMNREEIEWITQNLFVGNKLWTGEVRSKDGQAFDLREIKSPIVLFASLGDNITPPQQAFNWVADVYGSTDEIKARGQVIVGLLHHDVGHLGIFVSGRVAKKEHRQIVSVLRSIEALPPGLYGMQINEKKRTNGVPEYEVQFVERRLEEIQDRLNRFKRADERPFEAVEKISEFQQRAYELFVRPWIQSRSSDVLAKISRMMHPLRVQHWAISDLNPFLRWLGSAAEMVKAQRHAVAPDAPLRELEKGISGWISASLDLYRELRDASSEALFYQIYGNLFHLLAEAREPGEDQESALPSEQLPYAREALASMTQGGYPEAVARVFALLARQGGPIPLDRIHLKQEMVEKYADLFPHTTWEQQRRVRGRQEIIARYEPERALQTLPQLLANPQDRERLRKLLERLAAEERVQQLSLTPEQRSTLNQIVGMLGGRRPARANGQARTNRPARTGARRTSRTKLAPAA